MHSREVFRRNLRGIRISKGFSQEGLSLQSGLYRTYVGLIERGKHVPTLDTLDKLAMVLGVDSRLLLDPDYRAPEPVEVGRPVNQRPKTPRSPS
jgi:transcriptional regulator with XRE-family HTH domain